MTGVQGTFSVVIPCYHLVWYNVVSCSCPLQVVVIPCYHLVWYNTDEETGEIVTL